MQRDSSRLACAFALAATLFASTSTAATFKDVPCTGCLLQVPDAADRAVPAEPKAPLVAILHGDEGTPHRLFAAWRTVARRRGLVLFAPQCPKSKGCSSRSWWRWNGDPAWLLRQVDALNATTAIDPQRRYLAGWSGGTSYMGMHGERWSTHFRALSFAGGGIANRRCDPCPTPVDYLLGERNPLAYLAEGARDHLRECGHQVTWQVFPRVGHTGAWQLYVAGIDDLTTRLLGATSSPCGSDEGVAAKPTVKATAAPTSSAAIMPPAPNNARRSSESPATTPSANAAVRVRSHPPNAGCGCELVVPESPRGSGRLLLGGLLLLMARSRRRGR